MNSERQILRGSGTIAILAAFALFSGVSGVIGCGSDNSSNGGGAGKSGAGATGGMELEGGGESGVGTTGGSSSAGHNGSDGGVSNGGRGGSVGSAGRGSAGGGSGGRAEGVGGSGGISPGTGGVPGGAGSAATTPCPPSAPANGSACTVGYQCVYYDCEGAGQTNAFCNGTKVSTEVLPCTNIACGASECTPGSICVEQMGGMKAECKANPCKQHALTCSCAAELCGVAETCSVSSDTVHCNQ